MVFKLRQSGNEEILPGARDPEYADPLPPHITAGGSGERVTERPVFTIILAVAMTVVLYLSSPWGAGVRDFLFPPHQTAGLKVPAASTGPSAPEPAHSEPVDKTARGALDIQGQIADAKGETNGLQGKAPPGIPGTEKTEKPKEITFVLLVNGRNTVVTAGETLAIARSDRLIIHDIRTMDHDNTAVKVNFVGFVGNRITNDAEDRNYVISPARLLKRYSVDGKGRTYRIEATSAGNGIAEMFIRIDGE